MSTNATPTSLGYSDREVVARATPEQVAAYRHDGYLKFGRVFTAAEMEALREHVDEMIAALPEGKRPEEMDTPHFQDPWLFRYLAHPRILDIIECFIGPDIVLWSSHFIAKPRGDGREVPWHTDGAYWDKRLDPMNVITLWLAVDESTRDNGCMRVIPGSHRTFKAAMDAYVPTEPGKTVFSARLAPELIDETKSVDLELLPGECSFHDAWTIHGSNANHSEKRRTGYTMRYMPANVVMKREGWKRPHLIYLVRGHDQTGGKNEYTPVPEY